MIKISPHDELDLNNQKNEIVEQINLSVTRRKIISDHDFEVLKAYKDAEEHGMLWKLPCKVGDYVYQLDKASGKINIKKVALIDLQIMCGKDFTMQIWFETAGHCYFSHFGKTIFLDKADAIKALEEYQSRKIT